MSTELKFLDRASDSINGYRWSGDGWELECAKIVGYPYWEAHFKAFGTKLKTGYMDSAEEAVEEIENAVRAYVDAFSKVLGPPSAPSAPEPILKPLRWYWPW